MKKLLAAIAILAVAGVLAWMNWDKTAPSVNPILAVSPAPASGPTPVGPTTLGAAPDQRYRFALIDPTSSTQVSFRESMKNDLIAVVQAYVPPKPVAPKAGVPPVVGLQLTVRLVGTNSLAYGQPNIAVSIPSVPELPPRPDMTTPGALAPEGPYDTWKKSEADWSARYDAAVAASAAAVRTLQGLNVNTDNEMSGILAGTAALGLLAPARGDVGFIVASDLQDNRGGVGPQQSADFHGHEFLVVQPDPTGDIGRWDGLFTNFSSWATGNGAGEITRVRPEIARAAIGNFITGK